MVLYFQEVRYQVVGESTDGKVPEMVTKVIEVASLQPITTMIQSCQAQCVINGVVVQNGLTSNQSDAKVSRT